MVFVGMECASEWDSRLIPAKFTAIPIVEITIKGSPGTSGGSNRCLNPS
ncbi:MAG TPA: hypothetical protein VH796_09850 [Nitrososphaeraceae archaeon]|jgi:hypothetical protein